MAADTTPEAGTGADPADDAPDMHRAMKRIILAGCLAMVFIHFRRGAPQVAFAQSLGARPFHFGIIGALPPAMLVLQFVSGILLNRIRHRKRIWIPLMVFRRFLLLPVALLPWLFPDARDGVLVWPMIVCLGLGAGLGTFCQPFFFSWMGDILPHRNLNHYWAIRRRWMSLSQAGTMLAAAGFFWLSREVDIQISFLVVVAVATVAGVADILLFIGIREPPPVVSSARHVTRFAEPFRDPHFRPFILYSAYWGFSTLLVAPFFRLHLLTTIGLPVHAVVLLFTCHALGGTLFSERFGRLADAAGQRPVIVLCTALKSCIVIGMFLVRPGIWVLGLIPVLLLDNMLNTGLMVARNGFMLKESPQENRPMFVASLLATTGMAAAVGSTLGGALLERLPETMGTFLGRPFTAFHALFALGAVMRLLGFFVARTIHEPESNRAGEVLVDVVGPGILRWLLFPVGYFAHHLSRTDNEDGR